MPTVGWFDTVGNGHGLVLLPLPAQTVDATCFSASVHWLVSSACVLELCGAHETKPEKQLEVHVPSGAGAPASEVGNS